MAAATAVLPEWDHTDHNPLGQDRIRITLEDDSITWQRVCCCGSRRGPSMPMPPEAMSMFHDLRATTRRNALTTVTLAVIDFKETAR